MQKAGDLIRERWKRVKTTEDERQLLASLVSEGLMEQSRINLAAHLGHTPSLLLLCKEMNRLFFAGSESEQALNAWCIKLADWKKITCVRAAISAAMINRNLIHSNSRESISALEGLDAAIIWIHASHSNLMSNMAEEVGTSLRTGKIQFSLRDDPIHVAKRNAMISLRSAARTAGSRNFREMMINLKSSIVSAASCLHALDHSDQNEGVHIPKVLTTIRNDLIPWVLKQYDPLGMQEG